MVVEEALRKACIGAGETHARRLQDLLLRRERLSPEEVAELAAGLPRESDAALAVREHVLADERDRVRDGEIRSQSRVPWRSVREMNVAGSA